MNAKTWNGGGWIRPEKRLAIHLRDGLACCYCGATVEDGAIMTLDHIRPRSKGGRNEASNLVTACKRCNSARGNRPLAAFARAAAEYLDHGIEAQEIMRHIENCRRRRLDVQAAKAVMKNRRER